MLLLTIQAADAMPLVPNVETFDLWNVKPSSAPGRGCGSRRADEIIVCGSRGDGYRYRALSDGPEPKLPRAEVRLPGGATANAHLEGATLPNGMVSKRVMITIKKPF